MSSKIGLLFSMIFIALFFLLGTDLISLQFCYSNLDSISVTVGYQISKSGRIDDEYIKQLEDKHEVNIIVPSGQTTYFGDVVEFEITKEFKPIVMSNKDMEVYIKRTTVIGQYS